MDVSSISSSGQAATKIQTQTGLSKGALEQQEKVVMTLLNSTAASAPVEGKGQAINVVA